MLLLALLGCTPDTPVDTAVVDDGCVHPLWEGDLPFPSNRLVTRDDTSETGVRLALDPDGVPTTKGGLVAFDTTQLDGQDGFSRIAPAVVEFDGDLDPAAIGAVSDADAPMFLLDVDAGTVVPGRLAVTDDGGTLTVWPDRALAPGSLHAIVLRSDLPATTCFSGGPGLAAAAAAGDDLAGEMAAARTAAVGAGLADADIAATIPFTTRSSAGEAATMTAMREATPALVSPSGLVLDTVVDCAVGTLDGGYCGAGVAFAVLGHATLPTWRGEDGTFVVDADGVPAPQGSEDVPFWLIVPEAGRTAPAPLVVLQHGLGATKEEILGLGLHVAADGHAVVAIDAVEHGERRTSGDVTMNFFGIDFDTWGIARGRDNIRQTSADHLALRTLLAQASDAGAFPGFQIDATDASYLGQSLGGIIGASTCAADTGLVSCVLNVPGGRLVEIVRTNAAYSALMNIYFDPHHQQGDIELFSALAQTLADPADPAVVGPRILAEAPARPVLLQEATEDSTVANQTTEVLARSMGVPLLDPSLEEISGLAHAAMPVQDNVAGAGGPMVTAGLAQFEDEHGFITTDDAEGQRAIAQLLTFLDEGRITTGE